MAARGMGQVDVLTYQYDTTRVGANVNEALLTPGNVNAQSFGKIATFAADGVVYAQPLYVSGVKAADGTTRNLLIVATEHDTVYAFDADAGSTNPVWRTSFLSAGATPIPSSDTACTHIVPEIGISSTPAIDPGRGTIYVVASTKESGAFVHRLHALDLATGAERPGSPVTIQGSVAGSGDGGSTVTFDPRSHKQRLGLLLVNGVVYAGFSSHCDIGSYHGWLFGYDAQTLQQRWVFNTTPDGQAAALWQAGAAPAADSAGNIYVVSGNGTFDAAGGGRDFGESYMKLSGDLRLLDYFTPNNYQELNDNDLDAGSAGVVLLPDQAGIPGHPHLMIGSGKEGKVYVIDRDNPGKYQAGSDSQVVSSMQGSPLFGSMAYFNGTVYICGGGDFLRAFPLVNGTLGTPAVSKTNYQSPCVPSISANGASNGIVWTLDRSNTLRAYDAGNIANELYDSNMNAGRDSLGTFVKYSVPTIANGHVYAGTQNSVAVYGLIGAAAPLALANAASGQLSIAAAGSLISIKGSNLAQTTESAQGFPLPGSLGGATVSIGGAAAPLLFASPGQINAQVPFEAQSGNAAVTVSVNGSTAASGTLTIQGAAPGLFVINGQAAVVNESGDVNRPDHPAGAGSTVAAYLTGLGGVDRAVATGAAAPLDSLARTTARVTATIGGQDAQVVFAGLAPGFAGLYQVNLVVPPLAAGDYPLTIAADGNSSNAATISVR